MKSKSSLLFLAILTGYANSKAWALAEEHFGNAPLNEANYRNWKEIMPLVNHTSRVYHSWINGNENFYYRGDTRTFNEALRKFAAVDSEVREVVLRPAPGIVHSFNRTQTIPFNWNLHLVGGIASHLTTLDQGSNIWSKYPVMSVYVGGEIDLDKIEIPQGVTVVTLSDLRERYLKGLKSTDKTVRGWGGGHLANLDQYNTDNVAAIAKLLEDDDNWVRLNAAHALAEFGKKAELVLPALRHCLKTEDENLKTQVQKTINEIENGADTTPSEKEHRAILTRIERFQKTLKDPG